MAYPQKNVIASFTFDGMDELGDSVTIAEVKDSERTQERTYAGCSDLVNFYCDSDGNAISRPGYTRIRQEAVTSAWGNGTDAYCVANGVLFSFDGVNLVPVSNAPRLSPVVEFLQVNDYVLFSDNNTIGYLHNGICDTISNPVEQTDLLDLETWVKMTYPAGADKPDSNIEIDAFRITTFAGRCLCFFNGAVYLAVDNFLYCTKTFNFEQMDIRYNVVAGFSSPITLVKAVVDGIYVGTEKEVVFLAGSRVTTNDESSLSITKGFTQRSILPYGCYRGSSLKVSLDNIAAVKAQSSVVLFATPWSIYAGAEGGAVKDLTENRVQIPDLDFNASICATRFVLLHKSPLFILNLAGEKTVTVNLDNGLHSVFTNYSFDAFFSLRGEDYAAGGNGIYHLSGESDAGAHIEAHASTGSVDFGLRQLKFCPDVYLYARSNGDIALKAEVDEVDSGEELTAYSSVTASSSARRFRFQPPKGLMGNNWRFTIANTVGSPLTLFSMQVSPSISKRTV